MMEISKELYESGLIIKTVRDVEIPIFFPKGVSGRLVFVPDEGSLNYKLYDKENQRTYKWSFEKHDFVEVNM